MGVKGGGDGVEKVMLGSGIGFLISDVKGDIEARLEHISCGYTIHIYIFRYFKYLSVTYTEIEPESMPMSH